MLDLKFNSNLGKVIKSLDISGDTFLIKFEDNTGIIMADKAQQCCESRYMHSDDKLSYYIGAKLLNGRIEDVSNSYEKVREFLDHFIKTGEESFYTNETECQFLIIDTDKGSFTIANYNEHNGYYSGFNLEFEEIK